MTAPGWYPDPSGNGGQRYWDGYAWRQYAAAPQPAATPPLTTAQAAFRAVLVCVVAVPFAWACGTVLFQTADNANYEPPSWATKSEAGFLDAVHTKGITNKDGDRGLIRNGRAVCADLASGKSLDGLSEHWALTSDGHMSPDSTRFFVRTAAAAFCPEYL